MERRTEKKTVSTKYRDVTGQNYMTTICFRRKTHRLLMKSAVEESEGLVLFPLIGCFR